MRQIDDTPKDYDGSRPTPEVDNTERNTKLGVVAAFLVILILVAVFS